MSFSRISAVEELEELRALLLKSIVPINFQVIRYTELHILVLGPDMKLLEFILNLQSPPSKCNFGNQLEIPSDCHCKNVDNPKNAAV